MKAITQYEYGPPGDVLELKDIPRPDPGDDEVLVRIRAAAVNYSTAAFVQGKPFIARLMSGGITKPRFKIPGAEVAGQVEMVGANISQFKPGDEVFGDLSECGRGGYAEYVTVPETALALKPHNLSFEEAASLPEAAVVALQGLRNKGNIQPGQKVLIHGASGGIGTFAVQLARYFGTNVTAVCGPDNIELVRSLGADHVIDYTRHDFSKTERRYDLILAVRGSRSVFDFKRALGPGGICVVAGGSMSQILQSAFLGTFLSMMGNRRMVSLIITINQKDLYYLKELCEAGKLRPVIDKCYPLSQTAAAVRYYAQGHARGRVIIKVNGED